MLGGIEWQGKEKVNDIRKPEDWEAADHIENLKAGIGHEGICKFHDDLTRALIWMIRHMEKEENGNGKFL